jgi:hypothetical protein
MMTDEVRTSSGRSPYGRDELCGVIPFWEKH